MGCWRFRLARLLIKPELVSRVKARWQSSDEWVLNLSFLTAVSSPAVHSSDTISSVSNTSGQVDRTPAVDLKMGRDKKHTDRPPLNPAAVRSIISSGATADLLQASCSLDASRRPLTQPTLRSYIFRGILIGNGKTTSRGYPDHREQLNRNSSSHQLKPFTHDRRGRQLHHRPMTGQVIASQALISKTSS